MDLKDLIGDDLLKLVNALLAGFVASWVFYGLTPHPKTTPFERVVQALIFTAFVQLPLALVRWIAGWEWWGENILGHWTTEVELAWSVGLALAFGFTVAVSANQGQPHKLLSTKIFDRFRLTKRTAYPSEWANAFNADRVGDDCHATLHLTGQRRLHGWILEFPEHQAAGHFRIADAEWYMDDGQIVPTGSAETLISAEEVEFAEFDAKAKQFETGCGATAGDGESQSDQALASSEESELTEAELPIETDLLRPRGRRCGDRL